MDPKTNGQITRSEAHATDAMRMLRMVEKGVNDKLIPMPPEIATMLLATANVHAQLAIAARLGDLLDWQKEPRSISSVGELR